MKLKSPLALFGALTVLAAGSTPAQSTATITIQADQPGHAVSPTLWGVFFEDINLSADGGIYPEMIRNRSFEDAETPENWKLAGKGAATIDSSKPLNAYNRHSLRVKTDGAFTLENEGYWGMNIVQGDSYTLKLATRATDGFKGPLTVKLLSTSGQPLATGEIKEPSGDWKYATLELTATNTDAKAHLEISASGKGTLFLDMVSLLPKKTWKDHGLRPDLGDSLDALHPKFLRFPGGCWVEGDDFAHMNHWKKTIGDMDVREPLWNIWNYFSTHGLGYHEYLQLSEDLGATPLFCINVGMSHKEIVPMPRMGEWVQDALDAIEYANGPTNTLWGGLRAKAGHAAPFHLKYLEVGNENGGAPYRERWPLFVKAIHDKYPDIQFVANHWQGGYPKTPMPDVVDEHFYDTPEFFMREATHFDNYDRKGPKIFVGEYAVTKKTGLGNLRGAIGEAAFMTGLERNSDVVIMAAYAPLLVNLNHRAWNPDLINFDSAHWYGLPSYYVQQLFSEHRGDVTLPITVQTTSAEEKPPTGGIGVGTWNTSAEFKDIKVTAPDGKVLFTSDFSKNADGWKQLANGNWQVKNGALQQTAEKEFVRAIIGDKSWTDYTIELKARKLSGREGFLILFHIADDEDRTWWNLGGWGNTQHGVELGGTLDGKEGQIETGRWYDIRVEVKGASIKCSLDGKVIHDIKNTLMTTSAIYASATQDKQSGDLIVKVVNTSADATETTINFNGTEKLAATARAIVLTSEKPTDENSLENPTKVSPKMKTLPLSGSKLTHKFPGNSFTVLRIGTGK